MQAKSNIEKQLYITTDGHKTLLDRIRTIGGTKDIVEMKRRDISNKCQLCYSVFPFMPSDASCWGESDVLKDLFINLDESDLKKIILSFVINFKRSLKY